MINKTIAHALFTEFDIHLFQAGKHFRLYEKMGAHPMELDGVAGVYFAVWAPAARKIGVVGNFNHWSDEEHQLYVRWDTSGIWEGFIPGVKVGDIYKYRVYSHNYDISFDKADPFAFYCETPPKTASVVRELKHDWQDQQWMAKRHEHNALNKPFSVYEVHLASWKRKSKEENSSLSYRELADELVAYVKQLGFTHVELMPVMEHPYSPSWGYQITGYFAPTSRFGTPQDFMYLVEQFHQNDIGVILDWVPSHFPTDAHGLANFDGSYVYEHPDPQMGYHPDWSSLIFNYGRNEVRSFLISNALFWFDKYHADGFRIDAVASILYLDYSRKEGEWRPNHKGGNENLDAIHFLKDLNEAIYANFPDVQTIAEESTAFALVSRPTYIGGLGFGMKWMMGWMHDTLKYFSIDPFFRQFNHNTITFSIMYAFTENFMLPFSHDEVVHGKGSLIRRMPGDEWQRFANLRLLLSYQFTHPGAKLLFMGSEFGQYNEWNFGGSLDWHLTKYDPHKGVQQLVTDLNQLMRSEPALYEYNFDAKGFDWVEVADYKGSTLVFMRKGVNPDNDLIIAFNCTPMVRNNYRIGTNLDKGEWKEILNTDDPKYWGSGVVNAQTLPVVETPWNYRTHSFSVNLPPLGMTIYKYVPPKKSKAKPKSTTVLAATPEVIQVEPEKKPVTGKTKAPVKKKPNVK